MSKKQLQNLSAVLSLMFVVPACFKLFHVSIAVEHFAKWGIPFWMMHFIAVSELAGATGLLVPRTRLAASFSLFLLMIGGLLTHLANGEYVFALMPIVYGAGLMVVMTHSWPEALYALEHARGTA